MWMEAKDRLTQFHIHMSQLPPADDSWWTEAIGTDLIWQQPGRFFALGVVHIDPTSAKVLLTTLGSAAD